MKFHRSDALPGIISVQLEPKDFRGPFSLAAQLPPLKDRVSPELLALIEATQPKAPEPQ